MKPIVVALKLWLNFVLERGNNDVLRRNPMRSAFCMTVMAIAALPVMAALPLKDQAAHAAEAATGVYLLGSRGQNADITPPPGVCFQDDTYFYSGKIGGGTADYFTLAFPLMVDSGSQISEGKAIKAKF
jgi:hypothetical protein